MNLARVGGMRTCRIGDRSTVVATPPPAVRQGCGLQSVAGSTQPTIVFADSAQRTIQAWNSEGTR